MFAIHIEDSDLAAANYLHAGGEKHWWVVPPSHGFKLQGVEAKMRMSFNLLFDKLLLYLCMCYDNFHILVVFFQDVLFQKIGRAHV